MLTHTRPLIVVFAAVVLLPGCGDSGTTVPQREEKTGVIPARGFVTYKGDPLQDATVQFYSLDGEFVASGKADNVGLFVLSTNTTGEGDGIPPGKYKVTVAVDMTEEDADGNLLPEPPGGWKSKVPLKYSDSTRTDLLVEVTPENAQDIKVDID